MSRYPTLALVRGYCLGGGLELALACRYRVVVDEPGTRLGLPEVMLGIVPGWGGIRRLPRLAGAPAALDLLLTGRTIDARRAKKLGIADECVPVRIMDNTARGVLRALPPPRTLAFPLSLTLNPLARRFIAAQAAKKVAQRARREHYPAPYAVLDLWVKYDGDALAVPASDPASIPSLFRSPTTANLLRVFKLQERLKGLGKEGDFRAGHVHVVGAGTMGGDIAAWCALRGLTVTLQDQNAERLSPAMQRAGKLFAERLRDPRRVRDATDRLIPDVAGEGVARADVIIEAIFENVDAKRALFAALETKAKPDAILASNTSSIPLEDIAQSMADPSRLIGLHFFNPVPKMMLVEIVVGRQTREALVPQAAAFVRQIDKLPLPVKSAPGFLVNRVLAPYLMAAMRCVDEGIVAGDGRRGGARVRHADGADRARGHRGIGHLRCRRQDAGRRRGTAQATDGTGGRRQPRPQDRARFLCVGRRQGAERRRGRGARGARRRLVGPFVEEAKSALAQHIVADADLVDAGAIFGTGLRAISRRSAALRGHGRLTPERPQARLLVYDFPAGRERPTHGPAPLAGRSRFSRAGIAPRAIAAARRSVLEKIWLKHYPKGVPAEIDVNEYASVRDVFEESVAKYGARPAFSCMGKTLTFAELDTLSAAFGAWLQGIGCKKGARVALMMPNVLQYPVCLFGTLRAGCTVVNVNPLYTARELEHQLNDSGAEVHRVRRELRECLRAGPRQDQGTPAGDHVDRRTDGVQGPRRRLRAAACEEGDPRVLDSGFHTAVGRARRRPQAHARAGADRPRRHRLPPIHGRHDRRGQGRDAASSQHRRQPAAGARMGACRSWATRARSSSRRCRSITSFR